MTESVDLIIIAIYFVVVLGIGLWSSRRISNADDFARGNGKLRFPLLLGTLLATNIGGVATLGRAGKAYEVGIAIGIACLAYALGMYLFSYLAPILKRGDFWSVPAVIEARYGRGPRSLVAIIILITLTSVYSAQLTAFGLATVALFGEELIDFQRAVLLAALVMVIYTVIGGFLAVAYTDAAQAVMMVLVIGLLLPAFVIFDMGGGGPAASALLPEAGHLLGGLSLAYMLSFFMIEIPFNQIDISMWQRNGAAASSSIFDRALKYSIVFYLLWSAIAIALGIWASILLPNLDRGDAALPQLIVNYMPPVIKGVALAAVMAVMMSTADTILLIAGTTIGWDLYQARASEIDEQKTLRVTRFGILGIGVVGTLLALVQGSIFDLLLLSFAVYVSGVFIPTMGAIFVESAGRRAAFASIASGGFSVIVLYGLKMAGHLPEFIEPIFFSIGLSAFAYWAGARFDAGDFTPRLLDRERA